MAVDRAGAALRKLNADNLPRLRAKMRELKEARGWPDAGFEEKAYAALQDERMAALDAQANDLLAKLDALGTVEPVGEPDCAKLQELTATSLELQATVKAKAAYTLAKLDQMLAGPPAATAEAKPEPKAGEAGQEQPSRSSQGAAAAAPPVPKTPPREPPQGPSWETQDQGRAVARRWRSRRRRPPSAQPAAACRRPPSSPAGGGRLHHRRDHGGERRLLRQGVGQPRRRHRVPLQEQRPPHRLRPGHRRRRRVPRRRALRQRHPLHARRRHAAADDLLARAVDRHRLRRRRLQDAVPDLPDEGRPSRSTPASRGIDGSAYFVGGVGATLVTNGSVILAPIRSGVGLRLGANIGYIRFTPKATWNPF